MRALLEIRVSVEEGPYMRKYGTLSFDYNQVIISEYQIKKIEFTQNWTEIHKT